MLRRPCTLVKGLLYKRAAVVTCLYLQLGLGCDSKKEKKRREVLERGESESVKKSPEF